MVRYFWSVGRWVTGQILIGADRLDAFTLQAKVNLLDVCRGDRLRVFDLNKAISNPTLCCDWKIRRPCWRCGDDGNEFIEAAEIVRHLTNKFIMQMGDHAIAGAFEPQHGVDEYVTAKSLCGVLGDQATEGATAFQDVIPLPAASGAVAECKSLAAFVGVDARERIINSPARW